MSNFEYLVVPFTARTHQTKQHESISDQLQHVLNHYARYGWTYQRLELVNVEHNVGCLGGFFGQGITYRRHDVLVFRRPKPEIAAPTDQGREDTGLAEP